MKTISKFIFSICVIVLYSQFLMADSDIESFYELSATSVKGEKLDFKDLKDHVVLISNIALMCGTTPQLKELQSLYEKFHEQGFVVLGFPSNDFTGMEPKDPVQIGKSCKLNYGVTFPIFQLNSVKGKDKQDVFKFLTSDGEIEFNFEKFLVGKDGSLKGRYGSFTGAESTVLVNHIKSLLEEGEK